MTKRTMVTAGIAAAVLTMGMPVMAEYYTTSDGAIVLDFPDKTWELVEDKPNVTTMTNGTGTVSVLHYGADEELPVVGVPDEWSEATYQAVMADKEDVYVITGSAETKEYLKVVREIVQSAVYYEEFQYLESDIAEGTEATAMTEAVDEVVAQTAGLAANETISSMDAIMYAVAEGGLNIREACSSDAAVIGTYQYGESMNVIGNVLKDGQQSGWYQVGFDEKIGYVSAAYVSAIQPTDVDQTVADSSNDYLTGEVVYVYNEDGSTTVIKEYTDGVWRDRMGYVYESTADGHWIVQQ